ncbi:MAG: PIN domain-containing protein [Thermomicrobiales bacterium]
MIFVDTNVFIRYLVEPTTDAGRRHRDSATALLSAVERGEETITTSEVVIHEICYVLGSTLHYGLSAQDIVSYVTPILKLRGFRFPRGDKAVYLRAMEIFAEFPKLEYSDSLIAARAERLGIPLATFDKRLARLPQLTLWQPPIE